MHNEYFYDRSPYAALNSLNELQYCGANLWDLEHAARLPAQRRPTGFQPCPVNPFYHRAASARSTKYNAYRWTGEIKSTHHLRGAAATTSSSTAGTSSSERSTSPATTRDRRARTPSRRSSCPATRAASRPYFLQHHDVLRARARRNPGLVDLDPSARDYRDQLDATVKSLSNAFFLQDSYSPSKLRNLTINAGLRWSCRRSTTPTAPPS